MCEKSKKTKKQNIISCELKIIFDKLTNTFSANNETLQASAYRAQKGRPCLYIWEMFCAYFFYNCC